MANTNHTINDHRPASRWTAALPFVGALALATACGAGDDASTSSFGPGMPGGDGAPPDDDDAGDVGGSDDGTDDDDSAADDSAADDGDPDDDGTPGDDGNPDDDGADTGDPSGDPPSIGACQPDPTRMIILGDSIAACQGVGGKDSMDCAPKRFHTTYNELFASTTYENNAVSGAKTADVVNQQMPGLQTGMPGHTLVVIYVGGNDLSPFLLLSDDAAQSQFESLSADLAANWEQIFAFFGDATKFPDGVTMLVNSQYDPFDGCTAAPYNISQTKLQLLVQYNEAMDERGHGHEWVFVADQHSPYLGHGHHAADSSCPYFEAGAPAWMGDLIHPNAQGHANIAEVMAGVAATMYEGCPE